MTGARWRCQLIWPFNGWARIFPLTQAVALLEHGLPETAFTWHPVRQEVGNSKYQLPDAIDPI